MTIRLPHAPYIEAVAGALTEAKLTPAEVDIRDSEACGATPFLDAVITLTPEDSGIPADRYKHGLLLIWEYHKGHEDGCLNEGPVWLRAELHEDGSNSVPEPLPVSDWVMPAMLAATVATLAHTGKPIPMHTGWHQHLRAPVQDAIDAWTARH